MTTSPITLRTFGYAALGGIALALTLWASVVFQISPFAVEGLKWGPGFSERTTCYGVAMTGSPDGHVHGVDWCR